MSQHRRNDLSYADDFYGWAHQQAERLRAGDWQGVDVANLAEEIETLGRSEAAALRSSLRLIALHLLTFREQPQRAGRSWRVTVERERLAAAETRLPVAAFPVEPPFTLDGVRTGGPSDADG